MAEWFEPMVRGAVLAPSVHNVQGWRWRQEGRAAVLSWDPASGWPADDDAGTSCGAALEAAVLALSASGLGARVEELWAAGAPDRPRDAARIAPEGRAAPDPLARWLPERFTHRGPFRPAAAGWSPEGAVLVASEGGKAEVARLNDEASLRALRRPEVRRGLLDWMRLVPGHPRAGIDGMDRRALRMGLPAALAARLALGPLWPALDGLGATGPLTSEAASTRSAAAVALLHRPEGEGPLGAGRALLRLWLEATALGWAGWPMAAVVDDPRARAALAASIPPGRRLAFALRLGPPDAAPPPRARRPLAEVRG